MMPLGNHSSCRRSGFTLLEVLLTLSLAVVLIGMVGGALRFYAVEMNVRDMDIRQAQLAAVVMQMIEDDLRATLHTEPVDTSGLEALLATTAANVSGAAAPAGTGEQEDLSAAGIDSGDAGDSDSLLDAADTSTLDLQSGAAVLETPGLIGNQFQIQIDLSRLPRLEEYISVLDQNVSNIDDVPSDLKTVAYYVQPAGVAGGIDDPLNAVEGLEPTEMQGGLVRRSLDRAATIFAATSGGSATLNQTGELLAPEITGIEFAYWDGTTWLTEWSSDEYGELPTAVQVQLHMQDPVTALAGDVTDAGSVRTFKHIVRLPLARPIEEEDDTLSEAGI